MEPVDESPIPPSDEDQRLPPPSRLLSKNQAPLRFISHSLDLDQSNPNAKWTKAECTERLITWRLTQPLAGFEWDWVAYTDPTDPRSPYKLKKPDTEKAHVSAIQSWLTASLGPAGNNPVDDEEPPQSTCSPEPTHYSSRP
ncbi:hypothetical protein B0H14DRAFT_2570698 [Mycena olivaceomarginata]|nr:hypothetical protein B0H14DRAFT_2570698 [Mycena olivaceomarginata]